MKQPRLDTRLGVQAILRAADGFTHLPADKRRDIAGALVRIGSAAAELSELAGKPRPSAAPRKIREPMARSMSAGDSFSGTAVDRIAPTTQRILNAVSFPRFVGELITGVFKAMNDSNQEQLTAYIDLIKNVAATTSGFADANISLTAARNWLAETFAGIFEVRQDEPDEFDNLAEMSDEERREWQAEQDASTRLVLVPGASMPSEAALRLRLGLDRGTSVPSGEPEQLVPIARAAMARSRQEMLASMVMMGLQRIVVDGGRLNAAMRFHIDASSAAEDDRGSRFDLQNEVEAGARAQFGPWGAAARVKNTIGYVSTERTMTEEAVNASLDLNSSVELVFRTDYVPLERLAGADEVERIQLNSINPQASGETTSASSASPGDARARARSERAQRLDRALQPRTSSAAEPSSLEVSGPENAPVVPGIEAGADSSEGTQAESEGGQAAQSEPAEETSSEQPAEAAETADTSASQAEPQADEAAEPTA